jgi:hypothetical protein
VNDRLQDQGNEPGGDEAKAKDFVATQTAY